MPMGHQCLLRKGRRHGLFGGTDAKAVAQPGLRGHGNAQQLGMSGKWLGTNYGMQMFWKVGKNDEKWVPQVAFPMAKAKASYWENDSENDGLKLKIVAIEHNNKKTTTIFWAPGFANPVEKKWMVDLQTHGRVLGLTITTRQPVWAAQKSGRALGP